MPLQYSTVLVKGQLRRRQLSSIRWRRGKAMRPTPRGDPTMTKQRHENDAIRPSDSLDDADETSTPSSGLPPTSAPPSTAFSAPSAPSSSPPSYQTSSSSSLTKNSSSGCCRVFLKDVNRTVPHEILRERIKSYFEDDEKFGPAIVVTEVFLSDRNPKKHYGFVTFETSQQAQRVLEVLWDKDNDDNPILRHSSLFTRVLNAFDNKPRNQSLGRQVQRFATVRTQYFHLQHLASEASIILQVHKSHCQRYKQYVLDCCRAELHHQRPQSEHDGDGDGVEKETACGNTVTDVWDVSVGQHHADKSTSFVFIKLPSSPGKTRTNCVSSNTDATDRVVRLLQNKWYLSRNLDRMIVPIGRQSSPLDMTGNDGTTRHSPSGVVQASSLQDISRHVLRQIQTELSTTWMTTKDEKEKKKVITVRIHVFPPKIRQELLNCIHDQYEAQVAATEVTSGQDEEASNETNGNVLPLQRILLSPTNAQCQLTVIRLHDRLSAPDSDESHHLLPLYLVGPIEEITVPGVGDGSENASIDPAPKRPKLTVEYKDSKSDLSTINTLDETKQATEQQQLQTSPNLRGGNDNGLGISHAISRAYWKLEEAWERFPYGTPPIHTITDEPGVLSGRSPPLFALDCGASPGGWTKFLLDKYKSSLKRVYAVDPGTLDETVLPQSTTNGSIKPSIVQHVQMKIQKAWPYLLDELKQQGNDFSSSSSSSGQQQVIDVWVSDMCVKDMPVQVDIILEAVEKGLVGRKNLHHMKSTFFVLTLKCTLGHSMQTFDTLVDQQAERLRKAGAQDLCVVHLFSNRLSERTVMGYL